MKLIIVRHGETERNRLGLHVGHSDVPLNTTGQQQVERVADRLAVEQIDHIYSSDLRRAKETAHAIAARHPNVPLEFDIALRERHAGEFAGRAISEIQAAEQASGLPYRDWKPAGGESLREVKERAGRWYTRHCLRDSDKSIVVVGHGLFIYSLLEWAIEDGADVERDDFQMKNGGVTILDIPPAGQTKIIHLNDISHLQ